MDAELPADIADLIDRPVHPATADFAAESGYGWNTLAATENGNPLYWDADVAEALTGGRILPLSTLSLWMRPHRWAPGAESEQVALQAHFDLKARLGLPAAIMSDNTVVFHEPVRPGDIISHRQVLRSVSGPKTTRLGSGRFWVIDVEYRNQHGALVGVESYTGFGYRRPEPAKAEPAGRSPAGLPSESAPAPGADRAAPMTPPSPSTRTAHAAPVPDPDAVVAHAAPVPDPDAVVAHAASGPARREAKPDPAHDQVSVGDPLPEVVHDVTATTVVLGALASRDWRPMHHDYRFATERNGTRDIFLNTPNQLAWMERTVTDWTGPKGRLGRVSFRMRDPVFPGDRMTIAARVTAVAVDETGCGWAELELMVNGGDRACSTGTARVALPMSASDNPWRRSGDNWNP